MNFFTSLPNED